MPGIGIPELIIVLVILLVIFGPKRLPGLGKSLGSGMREFKDSISGKSKDDDDEEDGPRALERAAASSAEPRPADERVSEPRA
jgi:sec-independent protein translocase protein TatA